MYNITKHDIIHSPLEQKRQWAREGLAFSKNYIYLAAGLFIIGILTGIAYPEKLKSSLNSLGKLIDHFEDKSTISIIGFIFIRNVTVAIMSAFLGALLGLVPVLSAISNGMLLGAVISLAAGSNQLTKLWLIIPHGIFELPAIIIAWGLGMWYGAWFFRKDKNETMRDRGLKVSLALFRYCVPLLIIAAIIEGVMMKF